MWHSLRDRLSGLLAGPVIVFAGIVALWENEGRFDYAEAARDATIIESPAEAEWKEAVSYTGSFDDSIPIQGRYIAPTTGFLLLERDAEIYAWDRRTDSEGHVTWDLDWHDELDRNSRNSGLTRKLSDADLFPKQYRVDDLTISATSMRIVDDREPLSARQLSLNATGRDLNLRPSGEYFYRGTGSRSDPRKGDERMHYDGVPAASTVTYFGRINDGQGIAKDYDIEKSFVSEFIGNLGILHHVVNGPREEALDTMQSHFEMMKWAVRGLGCLAIAVGIYGFFSVFTSLLYPIPLLGTIVETGVWIVSLILGLLIGSVTIVVSILAHNPFILAIALAGIVGAVFFMRRKQSAASKNASATLDSLASENAKAGATDSRDSQPASPHADLPRSEQLFITLAQLAAADGRLDDKEKRFLARQGRKHGIRPARMKELFQLGAKGSPSEAPAVRGRKELLLAVALASIDGNISNKEYGRLVTLGDRIGLEANEVRDLIVAVQQGRAPGTRAA